MPIIFRILILLFLVACQAPNQSSKDNLQFEAAVKKYFDEVWELNPHYAIAMGNHKYDDQLQIQDDEARSQQRQFLLRSKETFTAFKPVNLSTHQQTDRELILNSIDYSIWRHDVFRSHEWNPSIYNIGPAIDGVLQGKDKTDEEKLRSIAKKLEKTEKYYKVARANIQRPTKEHTELAIRQSKGLKQFLKTELRDRVKKSKLKQFEKNKLYNRITQSTRQIDSYVAFLKSIIKKPSRVKGFRSFRIGKDLYQQKFKYALQSSYTPEVAYQLALQTKKEVHAKMLPIARKLWPKYMKGEKPPKNNLVMIKKLIEKISRKHARPEMFVETIKKQIPQLTTFVKEKDLVDIDSNKPLKVRETPIYQRGWGAGASIDAPGPFEPYRETFYNVTPLDNMNKKQKESYLREYNHYTLQILNIHEAIPGHYAQLVYSNKSPSFVKRVLGNGTMTEGWAVYAERMMLEEGYGQQSKELWLMYYKWFLRVTANTILDYSVHNLRMSKKQAMHLMIKEAFQEKAEAQQKWTRATLTQVQLVSYFVGFTEIYEFRENLKSKMKGDFSLKDFHEKFLSYGSSPIKSIKKLMTQ